PATPLSEFYTLSLHDALPILVSISGSHITMLAGAAALAVSFLWRRLRWRGRVLAERWPARRAGAVAALLTAWLYCLLAGWGVPRSEEHTSELQSRENLVCRLL